MPEGRDHPSRAQVVGTGLIGGSIGLALRQRGWWVTGYDIEPGRAEQAVALGALDTAGRDPDAEVTFIATPAGAVAEAAREVLDRGGRGAVSDVAGIKSQIVDRLTDPRFVGGHPMAGSEQEGVEGAYPDLFQGATWVLTPTEHTDPQAYATVQSVVGALGANVVALSPARHDDLVAMVSHVPHLTAATLMNLAAETAVKDAALLRLAAGGFRDMTRIASGHPGIWPDVCANNRDGILEVLDRLTSALAEVRRVVDEGDREGLIKLLEQAREARVNLPVGVPQEGETTELRIPVPDRPGVLAEITTLCGELGVNIFDVEIAHSAEGDRGVLVLVINVGHLEVVGQALNARDYRYSSRALGAPLGAEG